MDKKYIMAFDAGTTSERAIIFDKSGCIISTAQREFDQIYPEPGWVEHDPEILFDIQVEVARAAMKKANIAACDIAAIGITNQRETTIVWDKETGLPVYNAIVWQCRRTKDYCDKLKERKDLIRQKTGLVVDPYFSGTKIKWILDNVEGAREKANEGRLLFGTVETWMIWKLTKGKVHVTDYSNASRTMLFNIHTLTWDNEILDILGIPESMLPKLVSNSEVYGITEEEFLGGPISIAGAAGDQQAALFGQRCFDKGDIKNTYGTGCFLLMNTGKEPIMSSNGLVTTVGWKIGDNVCYAVEGSVFVAGALIQWLRDELQIISSAKETEVLARKVEDTAGCYIVPAFAGLGAPYWDSQARGIITGLTRGVNRNHIVRAALDAIAYQVEDLLRAMENDLGEELTSIKVDGGACSNDYLMQMQADISNVSVIRPECIESTALGAAYLAGLAVGYYKDINEIGNCCTNDERFSSSLSADKRDNLLKGWNAAIKQVIQ